MQQSWRYRMNYIKKRSFQQGITNRELPYSQQLVKKTGIDEPEIAQWNNTIEIISGLLRVRLFIDLWDVQGSSSNSRC